MSDARTRPPGEPSGLSGAALDEYKSWKPDAQERALKKLRELENNNWKPFYCLNRQCNGQPHAWPRDERPCPWEFGHVWIDEDLETDDPIPLQCAHCGVLGDQVDEWDFRHARRDQRPPRWRDMWSTLLMRGGRGSGKTRTGSEITNSVADSGMTPRVMVVGATGPDIRNTMVEGESGILATAPPDKRPVWEASKKQLTWPNGCIGQGISAEEPDRIRGPQSGFTWADEPAHWQYIEVAWENIFYSLRLGKRPKVVATSTPKATKWMRKRVKDDPLVVDRRVSSYANLSNLSLTYRQNTLAPHEGTRRGKQEIHGDLLEDVEGALWDWDMIRYVGPDLPQLLRVVVTVDPAGTANKRSDETGIIVEGLDYHGRIIVIADYSGKYSPAGWGRRVVMALAEHEADSVVAEQNYGGEMVEHVIETAAREFGTDVRVKLVHSRRGKQIRAEPVVALYEKDLVRHYDPSPEQARANLADLEDEQTTWVPMESPSPNRVDAMVHGAVDLRRGLAVSQISDLSVLSGNTPAAIGPHANQGMPGPLALPSGPGGLVGPYGHPLV